MRHLSSPRAWARRRRSRSRSFNRATTVALAQDAYYGTGALLRELERWGLRHVLFDQTGPPPPDVQLVWIEAPSNPLLTMPDFAAAAAHPAPVVCDSTAATPLHVRPLELGCDFALHSATKYLAGHHDAVLGAVVCRRPDDAARLRELRTRTGIVAAPDPAWLLLRGLKTLAVRVERQTGSARSSPTGSRSTPPYTQSVTRASAACSRSTSRTPPRHTPSRPRPG